MRRAVLSIGIGATALALTACASGGTSGSATSGDATPTVIATTTVLGDIAGAIATCGGGTAATLMPAGADPHDFAPSSSQLAAVADAPLVVANGLGLEAALADALDTAKADGATVLEIGPLVDPLPFGDHASPGAAADAHADDHADEHGHGSLDPHVWFDMTRMATAAEAIGDALAESTGIAAYRDCGRTQADEIRAADARVRATLATIPEADRVLVTDHDALGYFADAYGFRIAGAVTSSGTTLAEPSSADLAALADLLRTTGVRAIFANVDQPSALAAAVAEEAGTDVTVVPLHVESLDAPGTPASTYIGMMEENAKAIAGALAPGAAG